MIGYGEVLQTMGAMIIFSMILLSANSMIQRNTLMQIEGELEKEVIALAQDIIEEGRTKEFDANSTGEAPPTNIPEDFTSPTGLGPLGDASEDERHEFNDFDDYNGWEDQVETEHGEFNIKAEVFYVDPDTFEKTNVRTTYKKMRVYISSKYLKKNSNEMRLYKLEFIRNYYAD